MVAAADVEAMRAALRDAFAEAGVEYGLCCCGCGERTPVADHNDRHFGYVRGEPKRFILRHHVRRARVHGIAEPNSSGLCMCGCGQPTALATQTITQWGQVKGKPVRYVTGHHRRRVGPEYEVQPNGCWRWLGHVDAKGYGVDAAGGKSRKAHRIAYERANGSVPPTYDVHHVCRNKACVNPAHLEAMEHEAHSRLHNGRQAA